VSRRKFEIWIAPEIQQIDVCVNRLLTKSGVIPKDIDAIFMTGGSSFVPAIRKLFAENFFARPADSRRPGIHLGRPRSGDPRDGIA